MVATANNRNGDGAVKTYPNVHKDYHNWSTGNEPRLSSFATIRSSWAARTPHVGIYNAAYDIWLNGVPGNREVMIWTDNYRQTPAGPVVARNVPLSGHTWKVYATGDNDILTFLPVQPPDARHHPHQVAPELAGRPRPGPGSLHAGPDLLRLRDRLHRRQPRQVQGRQLLREHHPALTRHEK